MRFYPSLLRWKETVITSHRVNVSDLFHVLKQTKASGRGWLLLVWSVRFPRTNELVTVSGKLPISFRKIHHDYGENTRPQDMALPIWTDKCEDSAFLLGVHAPVPSPLLWPSLKLSSSLCSMTCGQELGKLPQEAFTGGRRESMWGYSLLMCAQSVFHILW